MNIVKRNGNQVPFNKEKIYNAVIKAFEEVGGYEQNIADDIATFVSDEIEATVIHTTRNGAIFTVESIQDLVEDILMKTDCSDVARAYIRYRYKREVAREYKKDFFSAIGEKLEARNVQNQNANVDEHSFGGRIGEADSILMKEYALNFLVSPKVKKNHLENRIYIHDLNHYAVGDHNCLTIPFDKLLEKGFNTRQTDIRPAGSINTAFQLLAVIFQLQSLQQFGGVSASHIDWTMVPYVRKSFAKHFKDGLRFCEDETLYGNELIDEDLSEVSIDDGKYKNYKVQKAYKYALEMTKRELKQAVEGMYHNLNTLQSRSGNQLPFTSINYGTCTLPEGRMVTMALLNGSLAGVGKVHRTPIFPCGIFQCMKGVNRAPGDPNYDLYRLALKSTAQRLYPNYVNVDWSVNAGYDPANPSTYTSTMGCRTYNGFDINGFGQLKDGRGNICPTTIILPTLAMEAREKAAIHNMDNGFDGSIVFSTEVVDNFMEILDAAIGDAKDALIERYEYICSQNPKSATFMYENGLMEGYVPEEGIRSALKHGTLAVGQLGLAEALEILIGKNHTTDEGMGLAKEIETLFNKRCKEFKEKYHLNFGVYYTPKD